MASLPLLQSFSESKWGPGLMTFESPIKRYEYYADKDRSISLVANEREVGCLLVDC
jgi:hypothetical protein